MFKRYRLKHVSSDQSEQVQITELTMDRTGNHLTVIRNNKIVDGPFVISDNAVGRCLERYKFEQVDPPPIPVRQRRRRRPA